MVTVHLESILRVTVTWIPWRHSDVGYVNLDNCLPCLLLRQYTLMVHKRSSSVTSANQGSDRFLIWTDQLVFRLEFLSSAPNGLWTFCLTLRPCIHARVGPLGITLYFGQGKPVTLISKMNRGLWWAFVSVESEKVNAYRNPPRQEPFSFLLLLMLFSSIMLLIVHGIPSDLCNSNF